jgi:hypothetical protein
VRGDVAGAVAYGSFPRVERRLQLSHCRLDFGRATAYRRQLCLDTLHRGAKVTWGARTREARAGDGEVTGLDAAAGLEADEGPTLAHIEHKALADLGRIPIGPPKPEPGARA